MRENELISPSILFIDSAYTLKFVKERSLEEEYLSRDCGGYFKHVWGVHPFADIPEKRELKYDGFKIKEVEFAPNQTVIEGLSGYYRSLKKFFILNFLFSQLRLAKFLITLVKQKNIQIIFSTDPNFNGLLGVIIKKFTKAKLVIWVVCNNDDVFQSTGMLANPRIFRKRWIEKTFEKFVFKNADLVAGGNLNNLEFALKNGASINKSTVFPVGKLIHKQHLVEPVLRETDEVFGRTKAQYNFVYIGRLLNLKFPDDVLRAFKIILKAEPDAALIIAGDGPMKEELIALSKQLELENKVIFLGNIDQMRLGNILSKCFAVLSPLTGRSLIEASLAALPIIAYDRDWQLDYITKSKAGKIVPFRDWEKMAEEGIYLINNPAISKEYSKNSRNYALELSDRDKLYAHEQAEFKKILK